MMVCGDLKQRMLTAMFCSSGVLVKSAPIQLRFGAAEFVQKRDLSLKLLSVFPLVRPRQPGCGALFGDL
jgi:hypothetical protein